MRTRVAPVLVALIILASVAPASAGGPGRSPAGPPERPTPVGPPVDPVVEPTPLVDPAPSATDAPVPTAEPPAVASPETEPPTDITWPRAAGLPAGAPDPSDRFIVILKPGNDAQATAGRHAQRNGVRADHAFRSVPAFSARLSASQRHALAADPAVAAVVPDELIQVTAQSMPTGVARVGGRTSEAASINGTDHRVDADVAIVDTGIDATHPDLNVVGGYNCSTTDPTAWRDVHNHGTHVAGTVGAIDDDYGVVGVAPGVRLYAVKILNDSGYGLLSWYVCGLDWIAAQKDPNVPSRQLFEAVNMSVAKVGKSDGNCGKSSNDILHQAICRLAATGVTVVAAAANEATSAANYVPAAYPEVITVSALADMDGRPGGVGPQKCGSYNEDDAFATFSNYGPAIDIMAPGKCIWSTLPGARFGWSSGTSMAAPHVAGAVALYKATRPWATTAEVIEALQHLGSMNWKTWTDPDGKPDILLDISRIGPYGDFALAVGAPGGIAAEPGQTITVPVSILRSPTFFERVDLTAVSSVGVGLSLDRVSHYGFNATSAKLSISIPATTPGGAYTVAVRGTEHGRVRSASVTFAVIGRLAGPDRFATAAALSAATFSPGVPVAYVATAYNYPDALAAAAAAGRAGGPVLLANASGTLNAATAAELGRLKPQRIVVVGSTGVVSDGILSQLGAYLTP